MPPFLAPFVIFFSVFRELWDLFRQQKYRGILYWVVLILIGGAFFYSRVEGWSLVDSFYFCVVTLATVGYGDLAPETTAGKLFTSFYILFGLGILAAFVNLLAKDRQLIEMRRFGKEGNQNSNANK